MVDPKELSEAANAGLQKIATMLEETKLIMAKIKAENEDHYREIMSGEGRRSLNSWYSELFAHSPDIVEMLRRSSIDVELLKQQEEDKRLVSEWFAGGCGIPTPEIKAAIARKAMSN